MTQTKLVFQNKDNDGDDKKVNYKIFTIESARRLIVEMIIIEELNEGFRRFVEGTLMLVESRFVIPSRTTITRDILGIYTNLGE